MRSQAAVAALLVAFSASGEAAAQRALSLVEGAACAHLSLQIETQGMKNEAVYNELGEAQVASTASGSKKAALEASARAENLQSVYEQLTALRRGWIEEYARVCESGTMSVSNLQRICRTDSGAFDFRNTAFCKPLSEAGL